MMRAMIAGFFLLGFISLSGQKPAVMEKPAIPRGPVIQRVDIAGLASFIAHCDHPLIVNFWATYCAPCVKEMPYLQSAAGRYKQQGVELVLVSLDRPGDYPGRIADFARTNGLSVRMMWLCENNAGALRAQVDPHWSGGLPSSLFINNGNHYRRFFDRQLTEAQAEPAIRELVK